MTEVIKTSTITHTESDGSQYDITYGFAYVSGRLEVVQVNVSAHTPNSIVTQKVLRSLSPAEATRNVRMAMSGHSSSDLAPLMEKWESTPQQLETVARLYREAYSIGESLDNHIAKRVNRPLSTVNRWIGTARREGYLRPAKSTRGGEIDLVQADGYKLS